MRVGVFSLSTDGKKTGEGFVEESISKSPIENLEFEQEYQSKSEISREKWSF